MRPFKLRAHIMAIAQLIGGGGAGGGGCSLIDWPVMQVVRWIKLESEPSCLFQEANAYEYEGPKHSDSNLPKDYRTYRSLSPTDYPFASMHDRVNGLQFGSMLVIISRHGGLILGA